MMLVDSGCWELTQRGLQGQKSPVTLYCNTLLNILTKGASYSIKKTGGLCVTNHLSSMTSCMVSAVSESLMVIPDAIYMSK